MMWLHPVFRIAGAMAVCATVGCAVPDVLSAPAVQASMPPPHGTQEPLSPLVTPIAAAPR